MYTNICKETKVWVLGNKSIIFLQYFTITMPFWTVEQDCARNQFAAKNISFTPAYVITYHTTVQLLQFNISFSKSSWRIIFDKSSANPIKCSSREENLVIVVSSSCRKKYLNPQFLMLALTPFFSLLYQIPLVQLPAQCC